MPNIRVGIHTRRLALAALSLSLSLSVAPRAAGAQPDSVPAAHVAAVVSAGGEVAPSAPSADSVQSARAATDSAVLADSVRQVARWLVANGAPESRARGVAAIVMRYARQRSLDPLLVVGVIGVENAELVTHARSRVGARGVMQVMPSWKKDIPECSGDMHDVRVNVCLGTAVLRIALDASQSVREALLRYNGCVKAPGCGKYATAVFGRAGHALLMSRVADGKPAPARVSAARPRTTPAAGDGDL